MRLVYIRMRIHLAIAEMYRALLHGMKDAAPKILSFYATKYEEHTTNAIDILKKYIDIM